MKQEQSRVMPPIAASSSPSAAGPVERIGRIADVIARSGAANEALGRLTPEVVDKLHEQRMFRLLLPRAYGGDEVDLVTWFRAMEALGEARRQHRLVRRPDQRLLGDGERARTRRWRARSGASGTRH